MKKIILLIIILIMQNIKACAIEEVILDTRESFNDHLSDVYYGNIEKESNISPAIKLFTENGLEFENSFINSVKGLVLFEGTLTFNNIENKDSTFNAKLGVIEPMLRTRFNNNKSELMFDINLTRNFKNYSNYTHKISRLYVSHNINEHQKIILGQGNRLMSTYNGSLSTMQQEFVLKSQLGRTFGNAGSAGIRNTGSYKYVDYDIGLYDSTRYMDDFGHGLDFTAYVMLKPFTDFSESINGFKIGSGYTNGKYLNSYEQYSFFAAYDFSKLHLKAEYADADGYNGVYNSNNKAEGFYTSASYDITPKLSLIARYDFFNEDKTHPDAKTGEYTAGITYKMYKNMKFMINYVRRDLPNHNYSNMFLFATRFII